MEIDVKNIVLSNFFDFWRALRDTFTFYVAKGGRNSGKSTTIAIFLIYTLIRIPVNILCIRKVATTIQESCYEQLKEAICLLDVENEFEFKIYPLRIIYKARGNQIIFRGADKPEKIKSIKTSKFPIAYMWVEEATEFRTEDELQTIIDSILRDSLPEGLEYKFIYSYNPAKRKQHWLNKRFETQFIAKNTYVHHSDYRNNHYLSRQTLDAIEIVKQENERRYNWIYLGEPIGGGVVPFENLNFRTITDEEISHFDNIRQGIDWGYAADPFAFGRIHYDKRLRKLYFLDEIYQIKLSNREASEKIFQKGYNDFRIIADSAEPKSIAEMRTYGLNIGGAIKGAGSVEYGEKWLDDLNEIVIDPIRTPKTAWEFENIDYQVDKDGKIISKLEDEDNHTIDMARYAMENDMGQGIKFG